MSLNELLHASIFSSWILLFLEASDERLFPARFSQLNMQHKNLKPRSQTHKEQRGKWENVPLGLQLFRVCRNDVICFYKTQFKFVPAFQELQQSASVETSCRPYFRTLEYMLHQNPANWRVWSCPPQFSLCPLSPAPHLKPACAARAGSLLSTF